MSRVIEFATAVCAQINTIDKVKSAQWQLGRFDLDELTRAGAAAPYVRVGILSAPIPANPDASVSADCDVAAFVVTEGPRAERERLAWTIGEKIAVLAAAKTQMWGLTGLGAPTRVRIEPITSAGDGAGRKGVVLLAVRWTQRLHRIGAGVEDIVDEDAEPASWEPEQPAHAVEIELGNEDGHDGEDADAPGA